MILLILNNGEALLIGVMLSEVVALVSSATATSAASVALLVVVVNGALVMFTLGLLPLNSWGALSNNGWGFSGSLSGSTHWLSSFLLNSCSLNLFLVRNMLVFVLLCVAACSVLSEEGMSLSS